MTHKLLRETYVEINLDNLVFNFSSIRKMAGAHTAVAAVVKADAYGHGAPAVAKTLLEQGTDYLAAAALCEAMELRRFHPRAPILIMGLTPDHLLKYVVEGAFTQTIFSRSQGRILDRLGREARIIPKVHIKIDSGFNRLGYKPDDRAAAEIRKLIAMKHLHVEGIFTHLALAGDTEDRRQAEIFTNFVHALESGGFRFRYKHICDSIAAVDYPEFRMDMIRPGAILYGMKSFRKNDLDLKPVMAFKSRVYHIKTIHKGEGVGYNYRWRAKRDTRIATIPAGYCDGYPRNMSMKGRITIRGRRAPVIGVVCMDQFMADVTEVPGVRVGDEVVLFGDGTNRSLTVDEVAAIGETNKNEIISRITRRVPRVYLENSQTVSMVNHLESSG